MTDHSLILKMKVPAIHHWMPSILRCFCAVTSYHVASGKHLGYISIVQTHALSLQVTWIIIMEAIPSYNSNTSLKH